MTAPVEVFETERPRLFGLAYRMLGSVAEADDIVQDAWLRFDRAQRHPTPIETPEAFLTTVTTRLAIDRLRSAQKRRETYVGPWLPEPVLTGGGPDASAFGADPAHVVELDESITLGFLHVLERLSPTDRAVFLLREVFGAEYAEVAEVVGKSEAACRQIAKRSRDRVRAEKPRFDMPAARKQELLGEFVNCLFTGDRDGLTATLAEDVVFVSDGGADRRAARKPVVGIHRVATFVQNLMARQETNDASFVPVEVNGEYAMAMIVDGQVDMVVEVEFNDDRLHRFHGVRNLDKLAAVRAAWDGGVPETGG